MPPTHLCLTFTFPQILQYRRISQALHFIFAHNLAECCCFMVRSDGSVLFYFFPQYHKKELFRILLLLSFFKYHLFLHLIVKSFSHLVLPHYRQTLMTVMSVYLFFECPCLPFNCMSEFRFLKKHSSVYHFFFTAWSLLHRSDLLIID